MNGPNGNRTTYADIRTPDAKHQNNMRRETPYKDWPKTGTPYLDARHYKLLPQDEHHDEQHLKKVVQVAGQKTISQPPSQYALFSNFSGPFRSASVHFGPFGK